MRLALGRRGSFGSALASVALLGFCGPFQAAYARTPVARTCHARQLVADEALKAEDWAKARALLEPLAAEGCPQSQLNLGLLYLRGQGVPPSMEKARRLWKQSADAGYPQACWNLAIALETGDGGPMDLPGAIHYLLCAAEQNRADAQWKLGATYLEGSGPDAGIDIVQDRSLGFHWAYLAALGGNEMAQRGLARFLQSQTPDDISRWRRESLQRLFSYAPDNPVTGGPSLPARSNELLYYLHRTMAGVLTFQRSAWNPGGPSVESRDSAQAVYASCNKGLEDTNWQDSAQCIFLQAKGPKKATDDTVVVSRGQLYELMLPGDFVLLSDGITTHYTQVFSIDRGRAIVDFADPWPEEFFLKPGSNDVGAKAKVIPWRHGKKLVRITRREFESAILAVLTIRDRGTEVEPKPAATSSHPGAP